MEYISEISLIALLPDPADAPKIVAELRELALLGETFVVLRATFRGVLEAAVGRET